MPGPSTLNNTEHPTKLREPIAATSPRPPSPDLVTAIGTEITSDLPNAEEIRVATPIFPYTTVCTVKTTVANETIMGTGVLIGEGTILTAAHVLQPRQYPKATAVQVSQGPWGQNLMQIRAWDVAPGWVDHKRPEDDLGVIWFNGDWPTLWPLVALYPAEALEPKTCMVTIGGYPAREQSTQLFASSNPLAQVDDERIAYWLDTDNGQSGSPIFLGSRDKPSRYIIGIHTDRKENSPTVDGKATNSGVRINEAKFNLIQHWLEQA